MELSDFFNENPRAALAFSGGADSTFLLREGLRLGADIRAYFAATPFQPAFELEDARRLAAQLDAPLTVVTFDVLATPGVADNPPDRCYRCKRALFSALAARAAADGYPLVIDGTNASDRAEERPGLRALAELGVRSPLRECGITKPQVRERSREAGLFTWNKPAYACLATRAAQGERLTPELLARVERAENALRAMGFSDFRVRTSGGAARLELRARDFARAAGQRAAVLAALEGLFSPVSLDLRLRPDPDYLRSEEV